MGEQAVSKGGTLSAGRRLTDLGETAAATCSKPLDIGFEQLFQALPPSCAIDMHFNIVQMNEGFRRMFGLPRYAEGSIRCFEIMPGKHCRTEACPVARLKTDDMPLLNLERSVEMPDGSRLHCIEMINTVPAPQQDTYCVLKTLVDISRRKSAESVLKKNEQRFRNTLQNIEDGYYEVDLKGNFLLVNDAICRFFGYSREELIGMNNRDYMDAYNAKKVLRNFHQVFENGAALRDFEFEVITKNGGRRSAEGSISLMKGVGGKPIGFRGIVRDISRRKMMEAALRESEEKYRLVVEHATEGILIVQNQWIKYANPRIQYILGYDAQALAARPFTAFLHPEERLKVFKTYVKLLDGEKAPSPYTFRVRTADERDRILQSKAVRINWEKQPAMLVFMRDITSQSLLESKLQHAQKMEAIGTLAGGIAHDFNNILGSIVLNTELALDDVDTDGEAAYSLEQVLNASRRAKDLVEQILTFSRNSEVARKPLKVSVIVKETLKMLRAMLPSTIVIKPVIAEHVGTVLANPTQIQQLIINLCTNAAHAMSEKGGTLIVRLENDEITQFAVNASPLKAGAYVKLSISDSGHGMSSEFKERIFDPFFTTKRTGEGTGLGLSVVHGIVVNHEGAISVDSELGKGTVFTVHLPMVAAEVLEVDSHSGPIPTGNKRILFADDEDALRYACQRMLERIGYTVVSAPNGGEAWDVFSAEPERFDLLITDMTMPYMTGDELAKAVLRVKPDIPIILCTGFNERITPESAKSIGICEYISKPYALKELAETIQNVLEKSKQKAGSGCAAIPCRPASAAIRLEKGEDDRWKKEEPIQDSR